MSDTNLANFELTLPPKVFTARTMSRAVADSYANVQEFDRDKLIERITEEHGSLDGIDIDRIGFWRAAISNSSLDSYFTRMAKSSLQNYAADASSPTVAFQNSHRCFELPVGRSVVGQFVDAPSGTSQSASRESADLFPAVIVDFYSHRDLQLGEVSVEQFLLGVKTHVIKDVSIGFKEGEGFRMTCSICGDDYYDWHCQHIAGMEYAVPAGTSGVVDPTDGDEPQKQLCFVWVENARLSEVSAVYDGATTNAMIIKAEREARAGRLDRTVETYLERRYRFRRDVKTWIQGADRALPQSETDNGDAPNSTRSSETMNGLSQVPEGAASGQVIDTVTPAFRALALAMTLSVTAEATRAEIEAQILETSRTNAKKAAAFDAFRTAEIELAMQEKIRAEGDTFDADAQQRTRTMLEAIDNIDTIREFRSEWKAKGDVRFAGGRSSTEGDEGAGDEADNPADAASKPEALEGVPVRMFAGGV